MLRLKLIDRSPYCRRLEPRNADVNKMFIEAASTRRRARDAALCTVFVTLADQPAILVTEFRKSCYSTFFAYPFHVAARATILILDITHPGGICSKKAIKHLISVQRIRMETR